MRTERKRERETRPVQVQVSRLRATRREHPAPQPFSWRSFTKPLWIDISKPHDRCPWC